MKKNLRFVFLLLLLTAPLIFFSESISIFSIKDQIPDELFKHFGSRSKNIQILNLTNNESDGYVLVIKGWIFAGVGVKEQSESILEIQTENFSFTVKIPIFRKGIYVEFGPYLLILPKQFKSLRMEGFEEISLGDL